MIYSLAAATIIVLVVFAANFLLIDIIPNGIQSKFLVNHHYGAWIPNLFSIDAPDISEIMPKIRTPMAMNGFFSADIVLAIVTSIQIPIYYMLGVRIQFEKVLMTSFAILTSINIPIVAYGYLSPPQGTSLLWYIVFLNALSVLLFIASMMGVAFLTGIFIRLQRERREGKDAALYAMRNVFNAGFDIQTAGNRWLDVKVRTGAFDKFEQASLILRRYLFLPFTSADTNISYWQSERANKLSNSLSEKQTWLMTPKMDTRDALMPWLGRTVAALLSGAWDELDDNSAISTSTPDTTKKKYRFHEIMFNSIRTITISFMPLAVFLIIREQTALHLEIEKTTLNYGIALSLLWVAIILMSTLDPLFKEKIAIFKEITQPLKSGAKKE
jgi:hypothetical protein